MDNKLYHDIAPACGTFSLSAIGCLCTLHEVTMSKHNGNGFKLVDLLMGLENDRPSFDQTFLLPMANLVQSLSDKL